MLILGQRETNLEPRRNAGRTHHADQQRVKIGAVAAFGSASPDSIPITPACAGLVVTQGGDDVVVDGAGLGERVRQPVGLLRRKLINSSLERNEAVGLEKTLKIGRHRTRLRDDRTPAERDAMVATRGFKRYADFG